MPKIDVEGFQNAWKALKDTPDFFMLTRKFGVSRTQALRLAPEGFAQKIENFKVVNLLDNASEKQIPIMVFVGNRGIIQIHTGGINKVFWHQQWFNVMDPDFNLHLDTVKIAETWIVKKPTEDGEVTSIEVFNKEGDYIVQFFGKIQPGIPELQEWKDLVKDLAEALFFYTNIKKAAITIVAFLILMTNFLVLQMTKAFRWGRSC